MDNVISRGAKLLQYHAIHNRPALRAIRLLRQNGRRVRMRDVRQATEYANDVLGSHRYAPWLIAYATLRGRFLADWIPDNFYGDRVAPRINQPREVGDFKTFTARVFSTDVVPDLAYWIDGRAYDGSYRLIPPDALPELLFGDCADVVMKLDRGADGRQVSLIRRETLPQAVAEAAQSRIVFQRHVRQHEAFAPYCSDGATLRMTTTIEPDGSIRLRSGCYKLPTTALGLVRSGVYVRVPFNPDDGRAASAAWTSQWREVTHHPHSGAVYDQLAAPAFAAARDLVCRLHAGVPHFGCIGWDVMIDQQQRPWIVEWNTFHNGFTISEAAVGPGFIGLNWETYRLPRRRSRV